MVQSNISKTDSRSLISLTIKKILELKRNGITAQPHSVKVDGLGAIFKREAYRASLLAKLSEAILIPEALFIWASNHFKNIQIFFYSKVDHDKSTRHLNNRFLSALPVPEILKNHSFAT